VLVLIPFCLFLVLAPYSLLLGWNPITLILFWFIIVPAVTLFLHSKIFKTADITWRAAASLASFYSFMVFMIYEHYQSDYFAIMMFSALYNLLVIGLVMFVQKIDRVAAR
jgi:hypothetical protein